MKHIKTMSEDNIIKYRDIGKISCGRIKNGSDGRILYRARGVAHNLPIVPMQAELDEFIDFDEWCNFVNENWIHDRH